MHFLAGLVGVASVLALAWFGFSIVDPNEGRAFIYAVAASAVVGAACAYLWQSKTGMNTTSPSAIAFGVLCGVLAIGASFFIDCLIAGVNPFDPSQWGNLWKSSGMFGFAITLFGGGLLVGVAVATTARAVILHAYLALTPACTPTRAEAARAGDADR